MIPDPCFFSTPVTALGLLGEMQSAALRLQCQALNPVGLIFRWVFW